MNDTVADSLDANAMPAWLLGELRSDQAGETGAVAIYHGILWASKDEEIRRFAEHHLRTEESHLRKINAVIPTKSRSRLLPLWRAAGFVTGALPSLFGARAIYATIAAVETFVDEHYLQQIERLYRRNGFSPRSESYSLSAERTSFITSRKLSRR
jgi:ubiquinone biosynthesis monooxygenase Coq7